MEPVAVVVICRCPLQKVKHPFHFIHIALLLFLIALLPGKPKIDFQGFAAKVDIFMEQLNGAFGLIHVVVKHVSMLVAKVSALIDLDGDNFACFAECFNKLVFGHVHWQELDENVGIVSLLHGDINLRQLVLLVGELVLLLADMLCDDKNRPIGHFALVHSLNCLSGAFARLEVNATLIE